MKTTITAQQIVYFQKQGYIRFENYPIDFNFLREVAEKTGTARDLWRQDLNLKKWILKNLGPIVLELTNKPRVRLACDHFLKQIPPVSRMQDMFCFQGLISIFAFSQNPVSSEKETILEVFEPSSLSCRLAKETYLVAFALENAVLIDNAKDPFTASTRNLGYVYGDRISNPMHPLIVPS
jgi:hypothetical protein